MKYKGIAITCDKPNANGHVYPKAVVKKMVEDFREHPILLGRVGMPEDGRITFIDVSHAVVNLDLVENGGDSHLEVEIEPLDAPQGKILLRMLEHPEEYALRTAGEGTTFIDKDGITTVTEDFKLTSVNFVRKEDAA